MSKRLRRGYIYWTRYALNGYQDDMSIPPFWYVMEYCKYPYQHGGFIGDKRRPTSRIGGRG